MRHLIRSAAAMTAGTALAFTTMVGTAAPAAAATSCHATFSQYNTIRVNSSGSKAAAAQCLLARAGYSITADTTFSAADAAVLKKFQRKVGLRPTGAVDRQAWAALLARGTKPRLRKGSNAASVYRLQVAMRAAGFATFKPTGGFGARTAAAVKAVQRKQGWRQTGVATEGVWRAVQSGGQVQVKRGKLDRQAPKKRSGAAKRLKALRFAKAQVGDTYRYGGQGPNVWDCSGLTGGAWKAAGVKLARTSQGQFQNGRRIPKSQLRPGDLVFFYSGISHVGIYAGNGKVVHAANPRSGVEIAPMKWMPIAGARRIA